MTSHLLFCLWYKVFQGKEKKSGITSDSTF
jgi:hypothetical protein